MAEAVLAMGFKTADRQRIDDLAEKAREGTLSKEERVVAESYERVGHLVSLLKSKARRSLASSRA